MTLVRDTKRFKKLLDIFPQKDRIKYCFAYGSAVFEQKLVYPNISKNQTSSQDVKNFDENKNKLENEDKSKTLNLMNESTSKLVGENAIESEKNKMIDLVLAVDNPLEFHRENLAHNWSHYSGLKHFGPRTITKIQQYFGAKIFYNTLIPVNDDYIKYGVISRDDLVTDLLDWDTLYIAGRLHKPTLTLERDSTDNELLNALKMNVQSAVHVALLLLPERFYEKQLYHTIAGLSYSGDFRMTFGEDKQKIEKIVSPQIEAFRGMYNPLLSSDLFKDIVTWTVNDGVGQFKQNCSINAIQWHLCLLPKAIQRYLLLEWIRANISSPRQRIAALRMDIDDLMQRLAGDITYREYIKSAIARIVFRSSATQSLKGIFTAGLAKSTTYSFEKIQKMFKSMK